ncbi:NAD-P-binding protein [Mycena vulgaris]|nr:NAD-P-binding protein [Mycena vulgaris]
MHDARVIRARQAPVPRAAFFCSQAFRGQTIGGTLTRWTSGGRNRCLFPLRLSILFGIFLSFIHAAAVSTILASFPKPPATSSSQWKHEFVESDASLLSNVHAAVAALLARLPRVHFLVLSVGYFSFTGRDDTAEGLDHELVLSYYARWAFATGILPALQRARAAGEPANVLSALGAGRGPAVDLQDLGLVKGYSGKAAMNASATYTDLMVEHWAVRLMSPLIKLAVYFMAKSEANAAEYGCFAAAPAYGRGSSDASRLVWAHILVHMPEMGLSTRRPEVH